MSSLTVWYRSIHTVIASHPFARTNHSRGINILITWILYMDGCQTCIGVTEYITKEILPHHTCWLRKYLYQKWLCERKAYHGTFVPKKIFLKCGDANARRTTGRCVHQTRMFVNVVMRRKAYHGTFVLKNSILAMWLCVHKAYHQTRMFVYMVMRRKAYHRTFVL